MISNFFVLSPRGDTIIAKQYRGGAGTPNSVAAAHERSHTEAFFRKVKFWDGLLSTNGVGMPSVGLLGGAEDGMVSPLGDGGAGGGGEGGGGGDGEQGWNKASATSTGGSGSAAGGDAPPVFLMPDGMTYIHVKRNGLIFGCATARNTSPCAVIELLSKIARVFKDYCGTLSEEAIRKNFILLYELLDEMLDYGYPQVTQTENLKAFVYNEPIVVTPVVNTGQMVNPKTAAASAVHKPVISSVTASGRKTNLAATQKNEIFVDILERLNVLFSNSGYVLNSTIDGCIQMKSYLAGSPELRLALNEDLVVGAARSGASVALDDVTFNDRVNLAEFEHARTLSFRPPDGEFVVLNYRMTGEYRPPFRIFPSVEETGPKSLELSVLIRAEMPATNYGANVTVEVPLPKAATAASCTLVTAPGTSGAHAEFVSATKRIVWTLKKFPGATEQTLRSKITLAVPCTTQIRREMGPISLQFEIPMYNVSNLQVRYLRIAENMPGYTPYRWVRYVTQSSSYVCRL